MRTCLICKDCNIEIFVDINMVMLNDKLWEKICDHTEDAICDTCMEKRLGREITKIDFKDSTAGLDMIPCNAWWLMEQMKKNKDACSICGCTEKYCGPETGGWQSCKNCGTI